jgi:branched-chain amino acid transport system permease protein
VSPEGTPVAQDSPAVSAPRSFHALMGWHKVPAWSVVAGVIVAAALPFVTSSAYVMGVLILIVIYSILNQAWNLTIGMTGAWNFGQLALFALGGYGAGIAGQRLGAPWWAALVLGALVAALFNGVMCIPSLRLKGIYVALLTFSFAEVVRLTIINDNSGLTGGVFGLANISGPFGNMSPQGGQRAFYWLALAICVGTALLIQGLMNSPYGVAFQGLRDSSRYAVSLGISMRSYYVISTTISALLSGVAGALYAFHFSTISPSVMGLTPLSLLVLMIVVGGMGTVSGPILGTIVVQVLTEFLRRFGEWQLLVLGVVLLVVLVLQPTGLTRLLGRLLSGIREWMNAPQAAKERGAPTQTPVAQGKVSEEGDSDAGP